MAFRLGQMKNNCLRMSFDNILQKFGLKTYCFQELIYVRALHFVFDPT